MPLPGARSTPPRSERRRQQALRVPPRSLRALERPSDIGRRFDCTSLAQKVPRLTELGNRAVDPSEVVGPRAPRGTFHGITVILIVSSRIVVKASSSTRATALPQEASAPARAAFRWPRCPWREHPARAQTTWALTGGPRRAGRPSLDLRGLGRARREECLHRQHLQAGLGARLAARPPADRAEAQSQGRSALAGSAFFPAEDLPC